MKLVIQRVEKAKVMCLSSDKSWEEVGNIGSGLLMLVGFKKGDSEKDVITLSEKVSKLRIMADKDKKMNLSVKDVNSEILVVSQFTLYADTNAGNRPSFINAEVPEKAEELYKLFIKKIEEKRIKVETGRFGNYMRIEASLDGPVTIIYSD